LLTSNPDVFSKTVFFINYDENGGFFDQVVHPTAPQTREEGLSTVPLTNEIYPGNLAPGQGLRQRPLRPECPRADDRRFALVKGGYVNSQLFDHTSVIRFIEKRFSQLPMKKTSPDGGGLEPAISPAHLISRTRTRANRRSNFLRPKGTSRRKQPIRGERFPDYTLVPPANQTVLKQEPGVRPARALPYTLNAHGVLPLADGSFRIDFGNTGKATIVFQVRSTSNPQRTPWNPRTRSTLPGLSLPSGSRFATCLSTVLTDFSGSCGQRLPPAQRQLDVEAYHDTGSNGMALAIANPSSQAHQCHDSRSIHR
jgi:phospholipase C